MSDTNGVPLSELHCPTCGYQYEFPLSIQREMNEDIFDISQTVKLIPSYTMPSPVYFIVCPNDHKWSLKRWWHEDGRILGVLLGNYIGRT